MKITSVINAPDTGISALKNRKSAINNTAQGQAKAEGRFDTFTMVGMEKKDDTDIKKLDAKKAELIKNLSSLTDEEKAEVAFVSYLEMAKAIGGMKESIEYDIFCFSDLKAEKAYYNDLLEHGGIIEGEGKYEFLGKRDGETADVDEILSALSDVQDSIDRWCGKDKADESAPSFLSVPEELPEGVCGVFDADTSYKIAEKFFRLTAATFSAVTGIYDSAFELKDHEFYFDRNGLEEDEFLVKANEILDAVTEREKKLSDIMTGYSYYNRHFRDMMKSPVKTMEDWENNTYLHKVVGEYEEYIWSIIKDNNVSLQSLLAQNELKDEAGSNTNTKFK